jgi:hypothetical protein
LRAALQRELGSLPQLKEIRGPGLMLGVELTRPCGALVNRAAEAGLLISVTADRPVSPFEEKSDNAIGYYVSGGLRYQLGKLLLIGAQVRRSWADVDLFGSNAKAGGTTILGEVGVGF